MGPSPGLKYGYCNETCGRKKVWSGYKNTHAAKSKTAKTFKKKEYFISCEH
jgi:hypothetical protein